MMLEAIGYSEHRAVHNGAEAVGARLFLHEANFASHDQVARLQAACEVGVGRSYA